MEAATQKRSSGAARASAARREAPGYASSQAHLHHHLQRMDCLLRAQVARWRRLVAANKPVHLWGMLQVSDAEIDAFLAAPFHLDTHVADDPGDDVTPFWREAAAMSAEIAARLARTKDAQALPLVTLVERFGLSAFEQDVLLLCVLSELDERYRRLIGYLHDDATRRRPTGELILQVLVPSHGDYAVARMALDAGGQLRRNGLIVALDPVGEVQPLTDHAFAVDERILRFLIGAQGIDHRLDAIVTLEESSAAEPIFGPEIEPRIKSLAALWSDAATSPARLPLVLAIGRRGSGRRAAAHYVSGRAGRRLLVASTPRAAAGPLDFERAVDLIYREALLLDADVYWAEAETVADGVDPAKWSDLVETAARVPAGTWWACATPWAPDGRLDARPFVRLDLPPPSYGERERHWLDALPPSSGFVKPAPKRRQLAGLLANSFQLTGGQIRDAVRGARDAARLREGGSAKLTVDALYEACRNQFARTLDDLVIRVEPRGTRAIDGIVLSAEARRQIDDLSRRIKLRSRMSKLFGNEPLVTLGNGLTALFTGSSGTGKTLAATVLAKEQGVDLFKVDLSAVVSKYVGETEKNLDRVFAEAETANAMLFFDEADALFGKRGDVREARDRWANLEVNFLLQRVEDYAGVVILASNFRQNIDDAFLRRIHVVVEFPFPDAAARARIWCRLMPHGFAPLAPPLVEELAERFPLAGGSIRNVIVDAAFRALDKANGAAPRIAPDDLAVALGREYSKLGKPVTVSEFGEAFYRAIEAETSAPPQ